MSAAAGSSTSSSGRNSAMTEAEWLKSDDGARMLSDRLHGMAARKQRLIAVACARRVAHLLPNRESHDAIDAAEQYADGAIDKARLQEFLAAAQSAPHRVEIDSAAYRV